MKSRKTKPRGERQNKESHEEERLKRAVIQFKRRGEYKEGIEFVRDYQKSRGANNRTKLDLAFFYYHLQKYDKAARLYREVLGDGKSKDCINAIQFLARVYALTGKKNEAISLAKTAYFVYPNLVMANNLANIYDTLNENKLAEDWYKKTLKLAKTVDDKLILKFNMAQFYKRIGKKDIAYKYAREILSNKVFTKKIEHHHIVEILSKYPI